MPRFRSPTQRLLPSLFFPGALLLAACLAQAPNANAETVHLIPDDKASFGMRNVFGWVRGSFYFEDRTISVETTPPGANLDLFYVRSNFQKRYEQAVAPATIVLPRRLDAGSRDSVTVRAYLDGYRQQQVSVRVHDREDKLVLDLAPLPNTLRNVAYTAFGGRASLTFLTDESPEVRLQKAPQGFTVVLNETAQSQDLEASLAKFRSSLIEDVDPKQLGDDLLVRVSVAGDPTRFDLRQRNAHDPVRDLYAFSIEFVPPDGGAGAVERARSSLARMGAGAASGCALRFDEALRSELEPAALNRALTPSGRFTDPFLRAAMKRLGEVSPGGAIAFPDGQRLRPAAPLELSAAMSQAGSARGYLSFLRAWVATLEPGDRRREALRSLVAPELPPAEFDAKLDRAEARERACRGG